MTVRRMQKLGLLEADGMIALLSALAQPTRLAIFRRLVRAGPRGMAAGDIGEALQIPPATLSFHLKELAACGLIYANPYGRFVIYTAEIAQIAEITMFLARYCAKGMERAHVRELCAALRAAAAKPRRPSGARAQRA